MKKIKHNLESVFAVAAVLGLFAVVIIMSNQPTNAQANASYPYPYPYPDPKLKCGSVINPYLGPYPAGCVYLPVSQNDAGQPQPTATATSTPTPTPSPTPSPTPTNTPTPTLEPYPNP